MSKIDKNEIAKKMFDEGDTDDLMINSARSKERVTIKEEGDRFIIKQRSPVTYIPLARIIKRSESQIRATDFDPEKHEEDRQLLESIRNKGVITPIMVKQFVEDDDDPLSPTKYELLYGHRRTSACKVLGYTTIPAYIVDSSVDSNEVTMSENLGVRTLTSYERGREISNYLSVTGMTAKEYAEKNGFSQSRVFELVAAYKSAADIPEIKNLYQDGHINSRYLPTIAKLYLSSDDEGKILLVEKLPEMSQKQMKDMIDICAAGGTLSGYLSSLNSVQRPETSSSSDKNGEEQGETSDKKDQSTDLLWDKLEKSRTFAKKKAEIYDCREKDVKESAAFCRQSGLHPDAMRYILAMKKKGANVNEGTVSQIKKIMNNPKLEKTASLYFSSFEKTAERRSSVLKQIEKENDIDKELVSFIKKIVM